MKLTLLSDDGDVALVQCAGEISQLRFQTDGNPLAGVLCSPGPRKVLLNLSRAEWIDSSGISWLIVCHKNYPLVLCSVPPSITETLRFVHMDRIFRIADDEAAARSLVAGREGAR